MAQHPGSAAGATLDRHPYSPLQPNADFWLRPYPEHMPPSASDVLSYELPQSLDELPAMPSADGGLVLFAPLETRAPATEELVASLPQDYRNSVFQKVMFDGSWIHSGGAQRLGITSLDIRCVLALPFFKVTTPLVITPGFGVHFLDSPGAEPDLPPRVYSGYTQFRHLRKLSEHWGMDAAVTVGWFSDFEQSSGDALRIMGHGMLGWQATPRLMVVGGVIYLDRLDIPILPLAGLYWNPADAWRLELMFPKPKIARRLYWAGAPATPEIADPVQDWLYFSAELGGGTWAVRRATGVDDELTYRDYRLMLGVERFAVGAPDYAFEIAYVFSREIEFKSGPPKHNPSNGLMLRVLFNY